MALHQNGGSASNVYVAGGTGITGAAVRTFSLWVKPAFLGQNVPAISVAGTGDKKSFVVSEGVAASGDVYCTFGNRSIYTAGSALTSAAWNHIVITYDGGNIQTVGSLKVYVNGTSQSLTNSGSATGVLDTTDLYAGLGIGFNGSIAEFATWTAVLTDDEITALSKGVSPSLVRPASRGQYNPLIHSAVSMNDQWGTRHLGYQATGVLELSGVANEYLIADVVRFAPENGTALGSAVLVNDYDAGFSGPGWTGVSGSPTYDAYYNSDVHFILGAGGNSPAVWTAANLYGGLWKVWASWTPDPNRATNAAYTVKDGFGNTLATATYNQESSPTTNFGGTLYSLIGTVTLPWYTAGTYNAADDHPRVYYPGRGRRAVFTPASADGVGSAAGTCTVSGVGSSTAASVGSAAGTCTVSAVGAAASAGVGSAVGTSTCTAVGASTAASVGSSPGTSTCAAVGVSAAESAGSAAGTCTVSGVGASAVVSVGTCAGTSTCAAVGASSATAVGSAAGTCTVSGVGSSASDGQGVGSASGTCTVSGVGASSALAVGAAAGTSTVSGVGTSAVTAAGACSGTSTCIAVGASSVAAAGSAAGTCTVAGVSASAVSAVGTAAGTCTVVGVSPATGDTDFYLFVAF